MSWLTSDVDDEAEIWTLLIGELSSGALSLSPSSFTYAWSLMSAISTSWTWTDDSRFERGRVGPKSDWQQPICLSLFVFLNLYLAVYHIIISNAESFSVRQSSVFCAGEV